MSRKIEFEIKNADSQSGRHTMDIPGYLSEPGDTARYVNSALWAKEERLLKVKEVCQKSGNLKQRFPNAKIEGGWLPEDPNYERPSPPEGSARDNFIKVFGREPSCSEEVFANLRGFMWKDQKEKEEQQSQKLS